MLLQTYNRPLSVKCTWASQVDTPCLPDNQPGYLFPHKDGHHQEGHSFLQAPLKPEYGPLKVLQITHLIPLPIPSGAHLVNSPSLNFSKSHTCVPRNTIKLIQWPHCACVSKTKQSVCSRMVSHGQPVTERLP